jgi:hypothetical protein
LESCNAVVGGVSVVSNWDIEEADIREATLSEQAPERRRDWKISTFDAGTSGSLDGTVSIFSRMKSLLSAEDKSRALKADFIAEMRQLSKLRHPCITTVMGKSEFDVFLFLRKPLVLFM